MHKGKSKRDILLVGAGGHAVACIDVIERGGVFRIAGMVGLGYEVGTTVSGYPVVMSDDALDVLLSSAMSALVAVGQIKSPDLRIRLHERLKQFGFDLPSIISPSAWVSERSMLGAGTIVMHGSIINAGASVGENCIINSRALIEHGVFVGAHCHIATGAIVNGDATVGAGTFIGSGVVLRHGINIGQRCVIGMGAVITDDVPDGSHIYAKR